MKLGIVIDLYLGKRFLILPNPRWRPPKVVNPPSPKKKIEKNSKKIFDLEMTLRSSLRSNVTKVNGEGPGSLGSIIREI